MLGAESDCPSRRTLLNLDTRFPLRNARCPLLCRLMSEILDPPTQPLWFDEAPPADLVPEACYIIRSIRASK